MGFACVVAPFAGMAMLVPQDLLRPDQIGVTDGASLITALTTMALGDLLGVLMVAPPIILLAAPDTRGAASGVLRIGLGQVAEIGAILLGALGLNTVFWNVGLSFQAMPLMLAVAWIGLRQGRAVTWSVLVLVTLLMLPFTALPVVGRSLLAGGMADLEKIHWHLGLASIVIVGYLAASYSDAESAALEALDRRNRLLLQADRLKTLRAMSVSVIHEISQPLTTLAIEARHLRHMTDGTDDLAESVRRIDGKAQGIATLVRRLRRFGERGEVAPALIAVRYLVEAAADLAGGRVPRRRRTGDCAGPGRSCRGGPGCRTGSGTGQPVAQCLVPFHRAGCRCRGRQDGDAACIRVRNAFRERHVRQEGMGVGLMIARTIVEACGGRIDHREEGGLWAATMILPLATGERTT
jgi:signal transduction histidine kinase